MADHTFHSRHVGAAGIAHGGAIAAVTHKRYGCRVTSSAHPSPAN